MSHRARVVAAVERHLARTPAGHYSIDARWPSATVAGSSLACSACGAEGEAPPPRAAGYSDAVEAFLAAHKTCRGAA